MHVQGSVSRVDNELKPFVTNWHDVIQLKKTNSVPILISRLLSVVIYEIHSKRSGQWKILTSNIVPWRHLFCEDFFVKEKVHCSWAAIHKYKKAFECQPPACWQTYTNWKKFEQVQGAPSDQVTKWTCLGTMTHVGRLGQGLGGGGGVQWEQVWTFWEIQCDLWLSNGITGSGHMETPPLDRQTDVTENLTFVQLPWSAVKTNRGISSGAPWLAKRLSTIVTWIFDLLVTEAYNLSRLTRQYNIASLCLDVILIWLMSVWVEWLLHMRRAHSECDWGQNNEHVAEGRESCGDRLLLNEW